MSMNGNGQILQFGKKTVRERLDEENDLLRRAYHELSHNAQIDRMRIALLERKLGLLERFGPAFCPICEDALMKSKDAEGKITGVIECPKCAAKPDPDENSGNV